MRITTQLLAALLIAALCAGPAGAQPVPGSPPAPAASKPAPPLKTATFKITDSFTAQRRPRVTVLEFDNANSSSKMTRYGSSVEAMLVTFLKRKSQFVVVERQKMDTLIAEKMKLQTGQVEAAGDDEDAMARLEKIDVFILGSVTVLQGTADMRSQPSSQKGDASSQGPDPRSARDEDRDDEADTPSAIVQGLETRPIELKTTAASNSSGPTSDERSEKLNAIGGDRIEIDVKLISRFDGRIVAAAQRSGPVACLRSIVERLGIALEQEYLRPYYGTLTVTLNEPEHIRVFLTPILPQDALDEEKPPVERSTTVTIGSDYDRVEPWTTDPTTYTIKNLLSGWYSMRVERPGYTNIELENATWEVRKRLGKEVVYDRVAKVPLDKVPAERSRFVVRVTPLSTDVLDIKKLQFAFVKEGGSLTPLVKRQYLDQSFSQGPRRVLLWGGPKIELNRIEGAGEYADDPRCDLFEEGKPELANYGRTYVTPGQELDFDQFTGGELIIEDYKGEILPTGRYQMLFWEPSYQIEQTPVTVRYRDQSSLKISLTRETATLRLGATGARPSSHAVLEGKATRISRRFPLDFTDSKEVAGIPVDSYTTGTDIGDLARWHRGVEILAQNVNPPYYDTTSKKDEPQIRQVVQPREADFVPFAGIKTRFGVAGRLSVLSRHLDPRSTDLYVLLKVPEILNRLLYGLSSPPGEGLKKAGAERYFAQIGRTAASQSQAVLSAVSPPGRGGPQQKAIPQPAGSQPGAKAKTATGSASELNRPVSQGPQAVATPQGHEAQAPPPDPFPKNPEALRALLAQELEVADLLILDPSDMVQLRDSPETALVISRWIDGGGSLFAFVAAPGDYRDVIGAPLKIEKLSRRTKRFDLSPGQVSDLVHLAKKKVKSKGRRRLPEITDLDPAWHVLAYTRPAKGPRIIESVKKSGGGQVILWFDDPEAFRGFWGGTRPEVEQTRANVEAHVLKRARNLMRSRFGATIADSASTPSKGE